MLTAIAGLIGDALLSHAQGKSLNQIERLLRRKGSVEELSRFAGEAVIESINKMRELETDLSGPVFLRSILVPHLLQTLSKPDAGLLTSEFTDRFFHVFFSAKPGSPVLAETLKNRHYPAEPVINTALSEMLFSIVLALAQSVHWQLKAVPLLIADTRSQNTPATIVENNANSSAGLLLARYSALKKIGKFEDMPKVFDTLCCALIEDVSHDPEQIEAFAIEASCIALSAVGHMRNEQESAYTTLWKIGALEYAVKFKTESHPRLFLELVSMNQGMQNYRTADQILSAITTTKIDDTLAIKLTPRKILQDVAMGRPREDLVSELDEIARDEKSLARNLLVRAWYALANGARSKSISYAEEGVEQAKQTGDRVIEGEIRTLLDLLDNKALNEIGTADGRVVDFRPSFWDFSTNFAGGDSSVSRRAVDRWPKIAEVSKAFVRQLNNR